MNARSPRILVTNWVHDMTLARLAEIGEVVANPQREPWPRDEILVRAARADAMLAFMPDCVDVEFVAASPRLKIVACALKGFDNFNVGALTAAGVWISIVPDLLTNPTAELAVGLAIGLGRHVRDGDALVRNGTFVGWRPVLYGTGLDQSTVTIIGLGKVGRAIATRLAGFGCRLLGIDDHAPMPAGVMQADLDIALAMSDYVILAVPLTDKSHHLIGAAALARMKRGALLVNIGRGSVVDEAAALAALEAGTLGGYAADVFEFEDWAIDTRKARIDPRLLSHPRTLFTPHLGSAVKEVRQAIELRAAENIADALAGRAPRDAINQPERVRAAKAG
jgi:phosphonate dehydrogenase